MFEIVKQRIDEIEIDIGMGDTWMSSKMPYAFRCIGFIQYASIQFRRDQLDLVLRRAIRIVCFFELPVFRTISFLRFQRRGPNDA